jgi:hypothetical protein
MARYYIYRIAPGSGGWKVDLTVRVYAPDQKAFITENEEQISS